MRAEVEALTFGNVVVGPRSSHRTENRPFPNSEFGSGRPRANYEMAAHMTLADMAWAHAEQTRIFRRFQASFRNYDLVLSPPVPVSPFPWTQLYLQESR